jgi:predicted nucleotidyltransferase component of viral defense system
MIDRAEILGLASDLGLQPRVVEKDYILGWVLAGIARDEELSRAWLFKGGTCLKKCFFETYRFSEDLDFTVIEPAQLDSDFLCQSARKRDPRSACKRHPFEWLSGCAALWPGAVGGGAESSAA